MNYQVCWADEYDHLKTDPEWDELKSSEFMLEHDIEGWVWEKYGDGAYDWIRDGTSEEVIVKDEEGNIQRFEFYAEQSLNFHISEVL